MSDRPDQQKPNRIGDQTIPSVPKPAHQPDGPIREPAPPSTEEEYDSIPVEELIRLTRQLTQRITNTDRQRLEQELLESGHQRTIRTRGPITLQQFFTGEIDLDTELAKRFATAPLMSDISLYPKQLTTRARRSSAIMKTQDGAATLTFDLHLQSGEMEATFTLASMLSLRFQVGVLEKTDRMRWLELMRRNSGIAFLWSKERWEKDYMIFVVRENFARVYAFSPQRFEAASRITLDVVSKLVDWLETHWPEEEAPPPEDDLPPPDEESDSSAFEW